MDMTEQDRADLGVAIKRQRERLFGTKKAAYVAAEVKAERGEALRGDRLRRIVRTLWPETEGDWTLVDDVAPSSQPSSLEERVLALEEQLSRLLAEHDDDQDEATTA